MNDELNSELVLFSFSLFCRFSIENIIQQYPSGIILRQIHTGTAIARCFTRIDAVFDEGPYLTIILSFFCQT